MVNPDPTDARRETRLASGRRSDGSKVPALLIRRAKDLHEPLIGKRARFLMTSHTTEGDWLSYGWKDGLRIVSETTREVPELGEPGVWVQEERDYYGGSDITNRFAVGLSRLWVEQYVSKPPTDASSSEHAWIDNLNRDPNSPELRPLHRAEGYPDLVGRRIVLVDGKVVSDMRAVGPVRMTGTGEMAVTVMGEGDWYRWAHDYPTEPHPSLRWVLADSVWVE